MTFRAALSALASLSVPGVVHNYDIDAVPDDLNRPQLPALLTLPVLPAETRLSAEAGQGFRTVAFSAGPRTATYTVTHLLLLAPSAAANGQRSHLPDLVDLMDAYFAALSADVTLGNNLLEPAHVTVQPGSFTYGHAAYHGCAFRHTWLIQI
ncbi:MAG: hypothetical protein R3E39_08300 [Anaerolineae bacterium]